MFDCDSELDVCVHVCVSDRQEQVQNVFKSEECIATQ